jgi:predicted permease
MLTAIILIVGGILGAASMIVKKKPEAAAIIGKIAPFQGIIGIGMLIWGVIDLLAAIGFMAFGILPLIFAIVEIVLGFLLGFNLIAKFMGEKGEAIFTKIAPMQGIFGIIAILLGILALLFNFGIVLIWF